MSSATQSIKKEAYQIVLGQLSVIMGLALLLFLFKGMQAGISTFLGGLAYCVPNFLFVWRVFARASVRAARQFAVTFFLGEGVKLVLGALLFVAVVKYLPVTMSYALTGYIAAILSFWIVSFFFLSRQGGELK